MSIVANKKIAIVGGGPGGLTLARLLQMNNADVTVYERDKSKDERRQGATLDLHEESGLKALQEANLMDAFREHYRPGAERMRIMDKYANILFEDKAKNEQEILRPEIDRGPLQNILLDSLLPDTVIWDCNFESMNPENGKWTLQFKNGHSAQADIVVAADGGNSKIRPYITPVKPFYSGIMVIEGSVYDAASVSPHIHKLLNNGKIFAFGDDQSLIVSSKGDGSLIFYTGRKTDDYGSSERTLDLTDKIRVLEWFKKEYPGWDKVYEELFENANVPFVLRPIYSMPPDQNWQSLPNVTILGDAAHLMPPFAGEGVNMAMLDALELSRCLTGTYFEDVPTAIAGFEQQMRARAAEVIKDSLASGVTLHSAEAIAFISQVVNY